MNLTTRTLPRRRRDVSDAERRLAWVGSALATAVLAAALVWSVAPAAGPYSEGGAPVQQVLGVAGTALVAAALQGVAAAIALTTGILLLAGRATSGSVAAWLVLGSTGMTALGLVGFDGIVIAGYTLAFFVPPVIVTLVPLLARRAPVASTVLAAAVAAIALLGVFGVFPVLSFYTRYLAAVAGDPARFATSLVLTAFVGVWALWAVSVLTRRSVRAGAFVQRHRVALAVAAAAAALPYVFVRATWLTPWPLFGGSRDLFAANPDVQVVGLMLGAAMLTGAILTLGLVLPWGERAPRWVPAVGGRPVPVALAAVPAAVVATLFTAGGLQLLALTATGDLSIETALILPFWAWGPLLGLATWGYVRHRAASA